MNPHQTPNVGRFLILCLNLSLSHVLESCTDGLVFHTQRRDRDAAAPHKLLNLHLFEH